MFVIVNNPYTFLSSLFQLIVNTYTNKLEIKYKGKLSYNESFIATVAVDIVRSHIVLLPVVTYS